MKTAKSVRASYNACIKHVGSLADRIDIYASEGTDTVIGPHKMAMLREAAELLLQRVHELSAYRNVLETE